MSNTKHQTPNTKFSIWLLAIFSILSVGLSTTSFAQSDVHLADFFFKPQEFNYGLEELVPGDVIAGGFDFEGRINDEAPETNDLQKIHADLVAMLHVVVDGFVVDEVLLDIQVLYQNEKWVVNHISFVEELGDDFDFTASQTLSDIKFTYTIPCSGLAGGGQLNFAISIPDVNSKGDPISSNCFQIGAESEFVNKDYYVNVGYRTLNINLTNRVFGNLTGINPKNDIHLIGHLPITNGIDYFDLPNLIHTVKAPGEFGYNQFGATTFPATTGKTVGNRLTTYKDPAVEYLWISESEGLIPLIENGGARYCVKKYVQSDYETSVIVHHAACYDFYANASAGNMHSMANSETVRTIHNGSLDGAVNCDSDPFKNMLQEDVNSNLSISPNPASNWVTLRGISNDDLKSWRIVDYLGKEMQTGIGFPTNRIGVQTLPSGIYFLDVKMEDSSSQIQKFVVQ